MKNLPIIFYETIPHKSQRYDTLGDYYKDFLGIWNFTSSKTNAEYEFAIFIHELIEWFLTQKRGISEESITKFDIESGLNDPGRSKKSPYHREHMFADGIERMIIKELGIKWSKYCKDVDNLEHKKVDKKKK